MAFDKTKFYQQFINDSKEQLNEMNEIVAGLEGVKNNDELEKLLRVIHTLKGASRMLGFKPIGEIAHKLEDVFIAYKNETVPSSKPLFNLFFKGLDTISGMVGCIETGKEIPVNNETLINEMENAINGKFGASEPERKEPAPQPTAEPEPAIEEVEADEPAETEAETEVEEKETQEETASVAKAASVVTETIRVDTAKLDESIRLLGEMVSSQQRFKQNLSKIEKEVKEFNEFLNQSHENRNIPAETYQQLAGIHQHFQVVVRNIKDNLNYQSILEGELREKVLHLRMVPLASILNNYKRLVRDLSESSRKLVDLEIRGGHTELDKKIVEGINDPLLHIVRNCIDHGIEDPDERVMAGKPAKGKLIISASYDGGSALIRIEDDGAGISIGKIKEKALRSNLYTKQQLEEMPERDIINIIFIPGFSTSKIITDISGRGVGMDVVKENIVRKMKGTISIDSQQGKGTTFQIRLPMTLAIMRILFFSIAGKTFGITVNSVYEIINVDKNELITVVNKKAIKLRDQIIPVINLEKIVNTEEHEKDSTESIVLILNVGEERIGIFVESLIDEIDVEIKPLPSHMKGNELVFGVTTTGDNEIVIVLNPTKVMELAKSMQGEKTVVSHKRTSKKQFLILVVDDSVSTREIEKSILESYGYSVEIAANGLEGFEKAEHTQYDLIITDIEMPKLDGFSLTEKLRKEKNYANTPIIIVSSRNTEEDKRRGIEVGADAYIIKGEFEQSSLLDTVQCLLY